MEDKTWAQCLSPSEVKQELLKAAEDQLERARWAIAHDERCSETAGACHYDLADLLKVAANLIT